MPVLPAEACLASLTTFARHRWRLPPSGTVLPAAATCDNLAGERGEDAGGDRQEVMRSGPGLTRGAARSLRPAFFVWSVILFVSTSADAADDDADKRWAATAWVSWGSDGDINNLPTISSDFEQTWMVGFSLAREFARTGAHFGWELEAGLYKHFGWQTHWEGDLGIGLRWDGYEWPKSLDSSVAVVTGVSYASSLPEMEQEVDPDSRKWLHFLALEIAFARPERPEWGIVARLHHRSSAYGLYGTENGGSNFYGLGIRRWF